MHMFFKSKPVYWRRL